MKKLLALGALSLLVLTACSAQKEAQQTAPEAAVSASAVATATTTSAPTTSAPTTSASTAINWEAASKEAQEKKITFAQIIEDIKKGAKFYDVRSADEFKQGNFGITENFPLPDMQSGKLPDVAKDTRIYLHCHSGRRSAEAAKILREAGFTNVVDMGGIEHVKAVGGVLTQ